LVRTSGNEVYIGHPMYAEVRKSRCGPSRLRRLRGQVAIAMKDNGSSAQIMKRGLLWLESDLPADSEVLLAAARAAAALLDFGAAERLFTAAADVGAGAEARIPLAFSLLMTQKGERIPEVLAAVDADEATQPAFVNDVALRAANLLWPLRSPELSRQFIVEALETARGPLRCQLLVFRAFQLALAARPREVLATMAEVGYENLDDHGTVMGFVVETVAHGELGHPDRAVESAIAGNAALSSTNPGKHLRQMLAEFHTFALATAGRITEAAAAAQLHHSSQHAEPAPVRAAAASILGMAALAAGDLEAALRHLPAAVEMENDSHVVNSFPRMHVLRAHALALTGRLDAAEEALNTARAQAHPAYAFVTPTELLAEAWLAAVQMRTTEARGLARRAAEFAHHHDQLAREVWCLQTAVQFDDMTAAGRLAELATQVDGPRVAVAARYAAALSADDAGELHAVSAEFEAMGDLLTAADAAGQAATAYRRAGLLGSAMTAAAAAQRLATICGGATSPAIVAASHVPPFTHREREIAALVAQGLSNRQIAEAVSLSVRTVESHIYRSSTKAGVAGRSGLAAMMRSAGR
jgi:DNA-binding NarL/FixJ family response regulator